MRGFANERGLQPLAQGGFPRRRDAAITQRAPSRGGVRRVGGGRARLSAARRMLDGVGGLGWSVIGFVLGALFWHFVGFWSFVSDIVLAGHPSGSVDRSRADALQIEASQMVADGAPLVMAWCTALQLDRKTGAISASACGQDFSPPQSASLKQREDRAPMSNGGAMWDAPDTPARALGRRRP